MAKEVIVPDEKGRGIARAVRAGPFLFISGMTGQWDLTTWEHDGQSVGDVAYQTRRIFEWAQLVLAKSGLTLKDVVKTTTFIRSMDDLAAIGRVRNEFFPDADVTSTTVAVADFVGTGDIEIEFIAMFPEGR
jgi:2-iminobutanoate/2-iminopropanoate deaminase